MIRTRSSIFGYFAIVLYLLTVGLLYYRGPELAFIKYADIAIIVSGLFYITIFKKLTIPRYFGILFPLLIISSTTSLLVSPIGLTVSTIIFLFRYALVCVLFLITVDVIYTEKVTIAQIRNIVFFAAAPSAVIAIVGWVLFQSGITHEAIIGMMNSPSDSRTQPFFYDPNHYASVLTIAYALVWSPTFEKLDEKDFGGILAYLSLAGILAAAVFTTGSRTGIGVVAFITLFMCVAKHLKETKWTVSGRGILLIGIPTFALGLFVIIASPDAILHRFQIDRITVALELKFALWKGAFVSWVQNPVFGIGPGNYIRYIDHLPTELQPRQTAFPHNTYVGLLSSYGLIGGIIAYALFFAPVCFCIRMLANRITYWNLSLFAAAIAILLWGLFLDIFVARRVWFVYGLIVASYLSSSNNSSVI